MKKILFLFLIPFIGLSQNEAFSENLFAQYETYKETTIKNRRFKHSDIQPLIERLKSEEGFTVTTLGKSIEGRSISMISTGNGKTSVLLWSQMHGNESTATMALFDIFNYLKKNKNILKNITIHFIPMLNPDGAQVFKRRNAIGIDINRDAVSLQSPESKILKAVRDSLQADFGFNLHDQSKYYNAVLTDKPATISYLAPAYNYEKSINETRANAMKIIVEMNEIIQQYAPGQVGRYSDDFEPRAFGDNIQKWGTSTILIESGGFNNDPEKQFIRKLNFVSILAAINSISKKSYLKTSIKKYDEIPRNDRKLFDLKITNLTFTHLETNYTVDLGINTNEIENNSNRGFHYVGRIMDIGDLSTYYGYKTLDAKNLTFNTGKVYLEKIFSIDTLENFNFKNLLKQGFTTVVLDSIPKGIHLTKYPIHILDSRDVIIIKEGKSDIPDALLQLGDIPTFILTENDKVVYAIINGFIYNFK